MLGTSSIEKKSASGLQRRSSAESYLSLYSAFFACVGELARHPIIDYIQRSPQNLIYHNIYLASFPDHSVYALNLDRRSAASVRSSSFTRMQSSLGLTLLCRFVLHASTWSRRADE